MISTLLDLLGNYYVSKDLASFEAVARSIHAAIPGDTISLQFLGLAYYRTGRIKDAKRIFDALIKRPMAVLEKCRSKAVVATIADDSAVTECYREATRKRPVLSQAWYDLGIVLLEIGRKEQAIAALRSALRANPDNALAKQAQMRAESATVNASANDSSGAPESPLESATAA